MDVDRKVSRVHIVRKPAKEVTYQHLPLMTECKAIAMSTYIRLFCSSWECDSEWWLPDTIFTSAILDIGSQGHRQSSKCDKRE